MAGVNEPLTCRDLPGYLERNFSDYLAMIWAVRALNHPVAVTADLLTSDVFVDHIFADAVKGANRELLARCFATVERALGGPDELLQRIFADYVVPVVLSTDRWAERTQELAGPLLTASLDASVGSSWRHQAGGFGPDEAHDPQAPLMVTGYLYQDEILWHSLRPLGTSIPLTEPFARVSARIGAYSLGLTVAKMLDSLSQPVAETPRHESDKFMSFVGCSDWTVFYAESLTVDVQGAADSYALSVWPVHKADRSGPHLSSWPDKPLPVRDWRDPAELGGCLRAAFDIATTTGRATPG